MPHPYLLQVFSQPHKVSPELWIQWYLEEHIRDMVHFGVVKTAAFYRASGITHIHLDEAKDGNEYKEFLAMFQTDRKKALTNPPFREKVRQTTALWGGKRGREVGQLADTESELVKTIGGTNSHDHSAAQNIVHFKVYGYDIESKLKPEHTTIFSGLSGYQRTLLYRPQEQKPESVLSVTLIHEFDSFNPQSLGPFYSELIAVESTKDCPFSLRTYDLQDSEGFKGICRLPARL